MALAVLFSLKLGKCYFEQELQRIKRASNAAVLLPPPADESANLDEINQSKSRKVNRNQRTSRCVKILEKPGPELRYLMLFQDFVKLRARISKMI